MNCIKRTVWLLAALTLSACSSGPGVVPDDVAPGLPELRSPALPPGPVTPNPYLADRPTISAAVQRQFEQAVQAMAAEDWLLAEQQLRSLADSQPRLSGVALNLGIVYRALGDNAGAEQAFRRALAVNPKNLDAWNQLAILKRTAGDFAGAEQAYRQALAVWPFHPDSHRNLGILYDLYLGQWPVALAHYQAYQQLLPEPDRVVNGWIVDLERRMAAAGQGGD